MTEPDPVAAFERGLLKRRAWGGVLLIGVGIGMLALGGLLLFWTWKGKFGYRPPLRIAVALVVLGAGAIAYSFRVFRGGYIDENNQWIEQARVPWRMIATYGTLFALLVVAVAGWPLGLYKRAPDASSCRELLTSDELSAIFGAPVDAQIDGGKVCIARFAARGQQIAYLEVEHDIHDPKWVEDQLFLSRQSHPPETPVGFGDGGSVVHGQGETTIAVQLGDSGARLGLGPSFDDARVAQVLDKLRIHSGVLGESK